MALSILQQRGSLRYMHSFGSELIRNPTTLLVESRNNVNQLAYRGIVTQVGTLGER